MRIESWCTVPCRVANMIHHGHAAPQGKAGGWLAACCERRCTGAVDQLVALLAQAILDPSMVLTPEHDDYIQSALHAPGRWFRSMEQSSVTVLPITLYTLCCGPESESALRLLAAVMHMVLWSWLLPDLTRFESVSRRTFATVSNVIK